MDIQRLRVVLRDLGAVRLYLKELAPNDNSKNQIYLAGDFAALHEIPHGKLVPMKATHGTNLKAAIALQWIDDRGKAWAAPNAQLILYPQYPEVRLSGMLQGAKWAPSEVIAGRADGRVMVFGITADGRILAAAGDAQSTLARSARSEEAIGHLGVLKELRFERQQTRQTLLHTLAGIAARGWITSKRLDSEGNVLSCNAPNCGGLTLEAELGIRPNSVSGPDYLGWEIKQHGVTSLNKPGTGVLTLMTPEPDGGDYKRLGVSSFIERYGYEDTLGRANRKNFGGIYKVDRLVARTNLKLAINGFDPQKRKVTDANGYVALIANDRRIAASWTFATLLTIWTRKHAQAVFVPSVTARTDGPVRYQYGAKVHLGIGTDFGRFLSSLNAGGVYYDPGIKLEKINGKPKVKRRSQFRVNFRDLNELYASFNEVDCTEVA